MVHNQIKVSVIMPSYNSSAYIKESIYSVLNQTHKNIELIIVDDCSSDNTIEIIKKINDNRIKLFLNEKNEGAAFSRNVALRESTGDYIAFLDADDLWAKHKVENQLKYMIKNNINFCYTPYFLVDEKGTNQGEIFFGPKKITHKMFKRINYIGCLTVMYKKEIYPNLSIPPIIKKRNDYALWLKISKVSDCYLFDDTLSMYRKQKNSLSSGSKFKLIKHHEILYHEILGYNKLHAKYRSMINVLFYVYKKLKFKRKIK